MYLSMYARFTVRKSSSAKLPDRWQAGKLSTAKNLKSEIKNTKRYSKGYQ
jgi:hypothetical protein